MKNTLYMLLLCFTSTVSLWSQPRVYTFKEAVAKGVPAEKLDSLYASAVHADTTLAVFKTEAEQETLAGAYVKLLQDLGNFLERKGFHWQKPTRCFNRIYFGPGGRIDYFLYNFTGPAESRPSEEQQQHFDHLLKRFVKHYRFPLQPGIPFAQCSPVVYRPRS